MGLIHLAQRWPKESMSDKPLLCVASACCAQWMLMVASVNIAWPPVFTAPLSAVTWLFAASSTATGLDCLLARDNGLLPHALQRVLLGLLVPCALLVILLSLDSLMLSCRRRRQGGGWRLAAACDQPPAWLGREGCLGSHCDRADLLFLAYLAADRLQPVCMCAA